MYEACFALHALRPQHPCVFVLMTELLTIMVTSTSFLFESVTNLYQYLMSL